MSQDPRPNKSLRRQAILWLIAQNSGVWSKTEQQALDAWLSEGIEHRQQYQQIQAHWQSMDSFKAETYPQREAAKHYRPPSPSANVLTMLNQTGIRPLPARKPRYFILPAVSLYQLRRNPPYCEPVFREVCPGRRWPWLQAFC